MTNVQMSRSESSTDNLGKYSCKLLATKHFLVPYYSIENTKHEIKAIMPVCYMGKKKKVKPEEEVGRNC